MELMGEGSVRWIRLTVVLALAVSGIVLQGLVCWYGLQTAGEEWGVLGIHVWAFAVGAWMVIVVVGLALLRKRLKDTYRGSDLAG